MAINRGGAGRADHRIATEEIGGPIYFRTGARLTDGISRKPAIRRKALTETPLGRRVVKCKRAKSRERL